MDVFQFSHFDSMEDLSIVILAYQRVYTIIIENHNFICKPPISMASFHPFFVSFTGGSSNEPPPNNSRTQLVAEESSYARLRLVV